MKVEHKTHLVRLKCMRRIELYLHVQALSLIFIFI